MLELGVRCFPLRGLQVVRGEWNLVSTAWNLKRLYVLVEWSRAGQNPTTVPEMAPAIKLASIPGLSPRPLPPQPPLATNQSTDGAIADYVTAGPDA